MNQLNKGLFKVYKSSAGAGKTYTLIKEYLKIVLVTPYKYKRILAITFTNKAANEMKERIVKQLSLLCYNKESLSDTLVLDLLKETNLPIAQLQENARIVLQSILHNYSDFAIGTIDSFTHKIVSTFAYDLKLPLKFEVELENETIISEAVNAIIERIGTDEELTKTLIQFAEDNLAQGKNWQVDADLRKLSSEIFKEYAPYYLEKIEKLSLSDFRAIATKLNKENYNFRNNVEEICKAICLKIEKEGIVEEDFYRGKQGIYTYFKNLCKFNKDKLTPNSYVFTSVVDDKWYSAKTTQDVKQKIDSLIQTIKVSFFELQTLYEKEIEAFFTRELLLENLYSLALLNEIYHVIHQYSKENSVLHISEFNKRIADLISTEPTPFIYERIGERYDHYFIDEFQDTSFLQWQNLLPLVENGLSRGQFSMLVGDAKQAIYRFRQGEVEQFIDLPNIYKRGNEPFLIQREKILQRNFQLEVLDTNYRSSQQIVEFNNNFFESAAKCLNERYRAIYLGNEHYEDSGLRQKFKKEGGYVSIEFINKEDYKVKTTEKVFQAIDDAKRAGYKYRDIVVLARSKSELNTIAEYLNTKTIDNKEINVISSESFKLWNSSDVRYLCAVLKFLENENDYIAQAQILNFLQNKEIFSLEEKERYFVRLYAKDTTISFLQLLQSKGLNFQPEVLLKQSIYDIIENIIRVSYLNEKPDVYIVAFLDYAAKSLTNPNQNISDFLDVLDEEIGKIYIKIPEDLDAIRLMTIHKSKGLEFPVVIYPFADSGLKIQDNLWVENKDSLPVQTGLIKLKKEVEKSVFKNFYEEEKQKTILDLLNVLYVALTRASERLYIFTKEPANETEKISYASLFKGYLFEKNLWAKEQMVYEFGSKNTSLPKHTEKEDKQLILHEFISNSWTEKITINFQIPNYWSPKGIESQIEKGVLLHQALSYIISEEDIPIAIEKLQKDLFFNHEKIVEFAKYIYHFLAEPLVKPFFEKGLHVKTEAEIILESGRSLRFDRIILKQDETIIIDFKTGIPLEAHREQMLKYKSVLQEMKYLNIKTYLIYLFEEECKVIEVR